MSIAAFIDPGIISKKVTTYIKIPKSIVATKMARLYLHNKSKSPRHY